MYICELDDLFLFWLIKMSLVGIFCKNIKENVIF